MDLSIPTNPENDEGYKAYLAERKARQERRAAEKAGQTATTANVVRCPSPQAVDSHLHEEQLKAVGEVRETKLVQTEKFLESMKNVLVEVDPNSRITAPVTSGNIHRADTQAFLARSSSFVTGSASGLPGPQLPGGF